MLSEQSSPPTLSLASSLSSRPPDKINTIVALHAIPTQGNDRIRIVAPIKNRCKDTIRKVCTSNPVPADASRKWPTAAKAESSKLESSRASALSVFFVSCGRRDGRPATRL